MLLQIFFTDSKDIVFDEAPDGLGAWERSDYWKEIYVAYKAGGYEIDWIFYLSIFGYAEIPFCDGGGDRRYIWGVFMVEAPDKTAVENTFNATKAELLREQIREGIASCYYRWFLPLIMR